ncbi:MAG TPA: DUF805 domain-containing protein [Trueperaceae bacterium]|jgi:uncharacterized membrane protein YhaH (DUF805 family)
MNTFNPFRFDGRIGRLQYFGFSVIWGVLLTVVAMALGLSASMSGLSAAGSASFWLLFLVYVVATVSYGVRRLHDLDKSGWWYLLSFVPLANVVLGLILLFGPGTPGANRFGVRDEHAQAATTA